VEAVDRVEPTVVVSPSNGESRPILFMTPSLNHIGGFPSLSVVIPHGAPLAARANSVNVFTPGT
jgi:hypothetical protein